MAKLHRTLEGLEIFAPYFDENREDRAARYDVSSFEDEQILCVKCKVSDEDAAKLRAAGWVSMADDDAGGDPDMWLVG